jgi:DNA repair photolyase
MRAEYREEPCRGALNRVSGMPFDWSLNPYMGCAHQCAFCYVRGFERRADRPSDDRYGTSIRVKINVAEVLEQELRRPSWRRETVVIGAATDPYQPAEGVYRLVRKCIEALARHRNPLGIITRGPLIVRDIDVLSAAARRAKVSVNVSIPTVDEHVWRTTEPEAPPPRQRLRAVRRLIDAGIEANVGMAPILPGISDKPEMLEAVVRGAREAGATRIWAGVLHLQAGVREHFMSVLAKHWPEERARYEELFRSRDYLGKAVTQPVSDAVAALRRRHGIADRRLVRIEPPEEPQQLDLAI